MAAAAGAAGPELAELFTPEYWRAICPHLHVSDPTAQRDLLAAASDCCCSDAAAGATRQRLIDEGYAALTPEALQWSAPVGALAEGARRLAAAGWPATALAVYDESWALARDAARLMERVTGNSPVMDTLGFFVDPRAGYKGFSPHRDRQPEDWMARGLPEDPRATFRPDGTAKYATVWIALTAANSDSSCLHFVPAPHDPGYYAGDGDGEEPEQDPMRLCFPTKEAYQHIRAVSLQPGGASFHTHRTIHWVSTQTPKRTKAVQVLQCATRVQDYPPRWWFAEGVVVVASLSQGSSGRDGDGVEPRISMSFSFADPEFEPPYIAAAGALPFPALELRVALVSAQLINYSSLGGTDGAGWKAVAGPLAGGGGESSGGGASWEGRLRLLHNAFRSQSQHFDRSYRGEIAAKYVAASADAVAAAAAGEASAAAAAASAVGPNARSADGGGAASAAGAQPQEGAEQQGHEQEQEEEGDDEEEEGEEEGEESGGFFGAAMNEHASEEDVLDEALDALLEAEREGGAAARRFTDDFDVMAANEGAAAAAPKRRRKGES